MRSEPVYIIRRVIALIVFILLVALLIWSGFRVFKIVSERRAYKEKYGGIERVEGRIKSGQDLFTSLTESKLNRDQANDILTSLNGLLDFTKLQIHERYQIFLKDGELIKFIYEKSPIDQYYVVRDDLGKLNAFVPGIDLNKEELVKTFTIKSSLFNAINNEGEEDSLVFSIVDLFAWDVDFNLDPRVGDTIKVYFQKYYHPDGRFVKYGRVIAGQYNGKNTYKAVYYPKEKAYFSPDGNPVAKMFLKSPLRFTGRITSYFGRRVDPITSRHGSHRGVDFASYYGAPIVSTGRGTVIYSGWRGPYGNSIDIRHGNGYTTRYGHCSKLYVRVGQQVSQGQVIAAVGSTGHSTGPHCHYEVHLNNALLNPLRFNQPKKKALKGDELNRFKRYARDIWKKMS